MRARVLVADDDPVTVALVAQTISRLGCDVARAEDGDTLLQQLVNDGPFDLVITDISMPWMTGLQVAHSVRTAGLATPMLVMTALPIDSATVESVGSNALLLRKPFHIKDLVSAVSQLVRAGSLGSTRGKTTRTVVP